MSASDSSASTHSSPAPAADSATSFVDSNCAVPWWGCIDSLWLLFVPLCVTLYGLMLSIGPNDFWYHARAGRAIVESGQVPRINGFSSSPPWVSPDTPFYYQSWIAEWTMFRLLQIGGLSGIVVARALCLTVCWSIIVAAAWRRARRIAERNGANIDTTRLARLAAGGAMWSFVMASNNMDTRPQMFSLPLFAAVTWAAFEWPYLDARRRWRLGVLLCGLMALWANTHGAFFTGLVVLGLLALGEITTPFMARTVSCFGQKAAPRAALGVLVACVVAACFNPRGVDIYAYVWQLATLKTGQRYIAEWQSPEFSIAEWNSLLFGIAPLCAMMIATLAIRRQRSAAFNFSKYDSSKYFDGVIGASGVRWAECLIALALLVMALRDKRSIIWFALFFAPLWSGLMASWRPPLLLRPKPTAPRATWFVNAALGVLLLFGIVPLLPQFKAQLDWPPAFRARFAPTPRQTFPRGFANDPSLLLDASTPVEAADFLLKNPPRGRVWHDMVFGSYLMWALDNRLQPMSDPRVELYPAAFWDDYVQLSNGRADAAAVLQRRGFSDALLDPQLQAPLLRRLQHARGWKIVFRRGPAVLLRHFPDA